MLKFDTVLAGGVELSGARAPKKMHIYSHEYYAKKVKIDADKAIHGDNITHRGPKLNKRLAITQEKFKAESDEVKEEIERKYRKAKAKFARARERLKGGKMPKVDTSTKVKYVPSDLSSFKEVLIVGQGHPGTRSNAGPRIPLPVSCNRWLEVFGPHGRA